MTPPIDILEIALNRVMAARMAYAVARLRNWDFQSGVAKDALEDAKVDLDRAYDFIEWANGLPTVPAALSASFRSALRRRPNQPGTPPA